jgi:hypothetical protein
VSSRISARRHHFAHGDVNGHNRSRPIAASAGRCFTAVKRQVSEGTSIKTPRFSPVFPQNPLVFGFYRLELKPFSLEPLWDDLEPLRFKVELFWFNLEVLVLDVELLRFNMVGNGDDIEPARFNIELLGFKVEWFQFYIESSGFNLELFGRSVGPFRFKAELPGCKAVDDLLGAELHGDNR